MSKHSELHIMAITRQLFQRDKRSCTIHGKNVEQLAI